MVRCLMLAKFRDHLSDCGIIHGRLEQITSKEQGLKEHLNCALPQDQDLQFI